MFLSQVDNIYQSQNQIIQFLVRYNKSLYSQFYLHKIINSFFSIRFPQNILILLIKPEKIEE